MPNFNIRNALVSVEVNATRQRRINFVVSPLLIPNAAIIGQQDVRWELWWVRVTDCIVTLWVGLSARINKAFPNIDHRADRSDQAILKNPEERISCYFRGSTHALSARLPVQNDLIPGTVGSNNPPRGELNARENAL
ncbi:MAG: hypothetical protein AAF989_10315 [Planctomycetota bacterium]